MAAIEVDSQNKIQRHSQPAGFQPVLQGDNYNGPTQEKAKSSKSQLWLIKVPHNFNPENLTGKQIVFDSAFDVPANSDKKNDARRYQILSKTCEKSELSSFRVLLPSSKKQEICPCKPFSGQLSVVQTISQPTVSDVPSEPSAQHKLHHNVKCRWKPFGFKEPRNQTVRDLADAQKKKKKRRKKQKVSQEKVKHSSTAVSSGVESPRKKRKFRHKEKVNEG